MPLEGGEADHLQVGINFRAVVNDLQRLPVQGGPLIGPEPFGIHIGEEAAEGSAQELFKGQLFQLCQRGVSVTENPVNSPAPVIEHHFDVRESERQSLKAFVVLLILLQSSGQIIPGELVDEVLLQGLQLLLDCALAPMNKMQLVTIAQIHRIRNIVNGHCGYQIAAVELQKSVAQCGFQLTHGHAGRVYVPSRHMNLRVVPLHGNIKHRIHSQLKFFQAMGYGDHSFFVQEGHLPFRSYLTTKYRFFSSPFYKIQPLFS